MLRDLLLRLAVGDRKLTVIGDEEETISWQEFLDKAMRAAGGLQQAGVAPGDTVAVAGGTEVDMVVAIAATWLTGACLVVVPFYRRNGKFELPLSVGRDLIGLRPKLLVRSPDVAHATRVLAEKFPVVDIHGLGRKSPPPDLGFPLGGDAAALIQLTSGTTGSPRAVAIPQRCLVANLRSIASAMALDPHADRTLSWLPLHHDMGLIGMLGVPLSTGTNAVLADASLFAAKPSRWLDWLTAHQATVTCAPNFAYGLVRKVMSGGNYSLERLRLAMNGAEPIDVGSFRDFLGAGAAHGLAASTAFCVYGLAEATLAVTFPKPGAGMDVDVVSRAAFEVGTAEPTEEAFSYVFARLGRPLPGVQVKILDRDQQTQPERSVGEVFVRGESVGGRYQTAQGVLELLDSDGWLATGDLGYLTDGELVVSGRAKDIIIVAGRNIHPESLERAASSVSGVRRGRVTAIGVPASSGRELPLILVEVKGETPDLAAIQQACYHSCGVNVSVELVADGSLARTTSGKTARSRCRANFLAGTYQS